MKTIEEAIEVILNDYSYAVILTGEDGHNYWEGQSINGKLQESMGDFFSKPYELYDHSPYGAVVDLQINFLPETSDLVKNSFKKRFQEYTGKELTIKNNLPERLTEKQIGLVKSLVEHNRHLEFTNGNVYLDLKRDKRIKEIKKILGMEENNEKN